MHSDYVVADITYFNPNVFYELGIRHACRPGTILIHDKQGSKLPFDLTTLRYIEYENTATGLKNLAEQLRKRFDWFDLHPNDPDNQFLELAKLTKYHFPNYVKTDTKTQVAMLRTVSEIVKVPEILDLLTRTAKGEQISNQLWMETITKYPNVLLPVLTLLIQTGKLTC
jgi:hypothetical protein